MNEKVRLSARNVAIVGPYLSGKTTLLESLLYVTGAISRKGSVKDGNTVGDSATEARDRQMSVEVSAASTEYESVRFTFLDCPGSVEFAQETYNALMGIDAAIVVCEAANDTDAQGLRQGLCGQVLNVDCGHGAVEAVVVSTCNLGSATCGVDMIGKTWRRATANQPPGTRAMM